MKDRKSFYQVLASFAGERQGRDDAANRVIDSDPLTSGLHYARLEYSDDPAVMADIAIEYQEGYAQLYNTTTRRKSR